MKQPVHHLVTAALLTAVTFLATAVFRLPSPIGGYINLGDGAVILAGCLLSPGSALLVAGIGSALADVAAGYLFYAPVTFVIKAAMALLVWLIVRWRRTVYGILLGGVAAELVMIIGYYVFEGFLYGFASSLINVPPNAVQGVAGLVLGTVMVRIFDQHIRRTRYEYERH